MIFLIRADDFILKDYQEHDIEASACMLYVVELQYSESEISDEEISKVLVLMKSQKERRRNEGIMRNNEVNFLSYSKSI